MSTCAVVNPTELNPSVFTSSEIGERIRVDGEIGYAQAEAMFVRTVKASSGVVKAARAVRQGVMRCRDAVMLVGVIVLVASACRSSSRTAAKAKLIDSDTEVAGTLLFQFEGPSPLQGTLRTQRGDEYFLASVEVASPRAAEKAGAPSVRDYEAESGPDIFSPFPERWPQKNLLGVREDGFTDATLLGDRGSTLQCRFSLSPVDQGFRGTVVGRCEDNDGLIYAAEVQ